MKKLLQLPCFKAAAVIFIVLIFSFITQAIAGSFGNYPIDEETPVIRKGSFVYASQYLNPEEIIIEETYADGEYFENPNLILQGSALISFSSPSTISSYLGKERNGIVAYEVQPGDIPSLVAATFGISTNTLLWANNLSPWDYIKPGQKLVILPVSGIKHKVKKGETLNKIVKEYKADLEETIGFNALPADGKLAVGDEIIVPNGQKPVYYYPQTSSYATYTNFERPYANESHRFPWGQCTWYVAQRRYIPWNGDAKNWLYNAERMGYQVCRGFYCDPKPGTIVSLKGDTWVIRRYGHVAYVESVEGNRITISEMNYSGLGIKSIRSIPMDDWRIIGYIY